MLDFRKEIIIKESFEKISKVKLKSFENFLCQLALWWGIDEANKNMPPDYFFMKIPNDQLAISYDCESGKSLQINITPISLNKMHSMLSETLFKFKKDFSVLLKSYADAVIELKSNNILCE